MSVRQKLEKTGPRKLLALDGGGIRGLITIEILAEIERTLRKLLGDDEDFVLADYFDYIGGTSTGAIIAVCLSLGMPVARIRELYEQHGAEMFQSAPWWQKWRYKYRCDRLCALIKGVIYRMAGAPTNGELDHSLGTEKLRTLLLLVMRNASTDSLWPICNHPDARFNCDIDDAGCNLKLPLWQLIRASAAAPTFFAPEIITLGSQRFVFDDGAMTPCVNPALQLFLMATARPYKLCWPTGEDRLLLVSVGTGRFDQVRPVIKSHGEHLLYSASNIPKVLIGENTVYHDFLCRVLGKCLTGDVIDGEVGDLINEPVGLIEPKLFTYLRYNADLSDHGLRPLGLTLAESNRVRRLDAVDCIAQLQAIGRAAAQNIFVEHFAHFPPEPCDLATPAVVSPPNCV